MTSNPQHARPGGFARAWRGFRRWRRSRPFWGGLFTALAGLEIFGTTQMSLNGLSFQLGPTGFLSWLIPTILLACGLLLWFSPQQRMFYAVVATITALFSLIGVNLGGFFIGLLLGMIGGGLGFAWVPGAPTTTTAAPTTTTAGPEPADEPEPVDLDALMDTLPQPREPEPVDAEADAGAPVPVVESEPGDRNPPHPRNPTALAVLLVLLSVTATGLAATQSPAPVQAAELSCPTTSGRLPRSAPTPAVGITTAAPTPAPRSSESGGLISGIIDGVVGILTGEEPTAAEASATPTPEASLTPGASAGPTPDPSPTATAGPTGEPSPTAPRAPSPCVTPRPSKPAPVKAGKALPRVAADSEQPYVAATTSKLTGSSTTMYDLHVDGVVTLPTVDGGMRALKFSMSKAVTDDFTLRVAAATGKALVFTSDKLTVDGHVSFYATRFTGRFLGVTWTLTPDLPFPDGFPVTSPVPLRFDDTDIDLAFVDSDTLTGRPTLDQQFVS